MAAYITSDSEYPPPYSVRFTSFASQLVLHSETDDAPAGVNWLPGQVVVEVDTADQHLDYIDLAGAAVAMEFPAVGTYVLRMAPVSIETSTTVAAVTVFWYQR